MSNVRVSISNASTNIAGTNNMYDEYQEKLTKADLFVKELKKKEEMNNRIIRASFWFLVLACIFVFLRRILFPGLYR
jgi:hypothetical protein